MIKFGTGGWRAIIADEFTKQNVEILTQALCDLIKDEGRENTGVIIGYDRRFMSKEAAIWAAQVFAGNGTLCFILTNPSPTPQIMFTVKKHNLSYGLAITASHNPAIYNGIKLFTKGGRDATEKITLQLEKYIDKVHSVKVVSYEQGKIENLIQEVNTQNEYIDEILSLVNVEAIKNANLKIVLDPMYGVGRTCLQTILLTARCDLDVIHDRHDALFGGRLPSPNFETLGSLSRYVVENNCDFGIATDGDADRLGVIDDKGEFIHPNKLMVLLYYYLIEHRKVCGPVVRNMSTTHLLDRVAEYYSQECFEVPVGFKHISSKMEESGAIIGGESSGGLTVKGHILGKDGVYAATLLAEMVAVTGKTLSILYKEIEEKFGASYIYDRDIFLKNEKEKDDLRNKIFTDKVLPEFHFNVKHISYLDGCKVYFDNGGWVVARFSGTEPLLRISSEMPTPEDAVIVVKQFLKELNI